jgi:hypothetical protein
VHLVNGKISGGDSIFTYGGSYEVDEDRFTATLTTRRHAAGPPTVFGVDEVEAKLEGKFNDKMALCSGTAEQAPGVVFEATLFLSPHFSQFGLKLRRLLQLCGRRARGARDVGAEGAAGDLVFCGSPWAFG